MSHEKRQVQDNKHFSFILSKHICLLLRCITNILQNCQDNRGKHKQNP